jgi:polysaccharide export outer membrane protein
MTVLTRRTILALGVSTACSAQPSNTLRETFTITGNVVKPGAYELRRGINIADAIAMAGGFTDSAQINKITLIRGDHKFHFNYSAFRRGDAPDSNILLVSGDQIIVP